MFSKLNVVHILNTNCGSSEINTTPTRTCHSIWTILHQISIFIWKGPTGYPFFGVMFEMKHIFDGRLYFHKLAQKYGDIVSCYVGSKWVNFFYQILSQSNSTPIWQFRMYSIYHNVLRPTKNWNVSVKIAWKGRVKMCLLF